MDGELFLALFVAHLLGDFFLEPRRWAEDRRRRGLGSPWLYGQALVHGLLAWLALGGDGPLAAAVAGGHVVLGALRSIGERGTGRATWMAVEQAAHLCVLVAVAAHVGERSGLAPLGESLPRGPLLLAAAAALLLSRPTSLWISAFTQRWQAELSERTDNLPGAGHWIGLIERQLILLFVLTDHLSAVGFLVAAKGAFRLGELREGADRRRAEYVLVGTLASFAIAMGVALLAKLALTTFEAAGAGR